MNYNFKNLNEVERQDKPTENTTVMAFEAGNPKQIPASEFGGKGLVVDLRSYTLNEETGELVIEDMSYDPLYEAITAGQNVVLRVQHRGMEGFLTSCGCSLHPELGFIILTVDISVRFTNGSYHTTA